MQLGFHLSNQSLELRMLVCVGLLESARHLGGVGRPHEVSKPGSEQHLLGPLARQAVGEDDALAVLLLDEIDHVGANLLVHPGSRLAPDLESLKQLLSLGWLELEQGLDPTREVLADRVALLELDRLACARGVLDISLEFPRQEVDVSNPDVFRARD